MKNLFCLFLIFFFLLLFLFSCKQKINHDKEISRLDSAVVKLEEAKKNFISVDTNSLRTSYVYAEEKLRSISEKVSKDTIKKKTAMFLTDAYEQTGNINNLLENKKYLERAINESHQRISDLKHDLKEDLIEENKSDGYVVAEINATQKIYETVSHAIEKAKSSAGKLDSMKTQIEFLSDSLQSK